MADQAEIGGVAGAGKARKQKEGVFISYARRDGKHFAEKLRDHLEREGIPCWQDIVGMEGGRDWWMQIQDAINSVEFLVLVMTPAAMQSKTVHKEWRYARQQGVCVYPVIATPPAEFDALLNVLPRWMRDVHFYNLGQDTEHFEHGSNWLRFLNDLRTLCEVPRVPFMADDLGVYIQRSKEYDALIDLLLDTERDEPKAITSALALKGAGGYGKTTLARAICHDERIQEAFDDGILWVTLGESATMDTVRQQIDSLITVLNGERFDAPTLEAAKTRLRELLGDRDILLVVDDVWNTDQVRPFLEGGERVARLITTRIGDTLPQGTRHVSVNQMTGDEAYALIAYELPADQADAQQDDLVRMAARLGEYPLLLKLTNGILHDRMHDGDPLEKALDYLKRAFDKRGITKAIQIENSEDRNRAVDASLRLSLERLNEQRREWFNRLAIFPDDMAIPFKTLEKAWDCDDLDVEDTCAAFSRLSLLLSYNLQTRTVALHDVVRAYLREQLIGGPGKLKAANGIFLDRYGITHWRDLSTDEPYLWDNLAYHLIEAGRDEDLIETVLDLRYVAVKTFHRGTGKVEADVNTATAFARLNERPQTYALSLLERNYRNIAHILARCESVKDVITAIYIRLCHYEVLADFCKDGLTHLNLPYLVLWRDLPDRPHPDLIRTLTGHQDWVNSACFSTNARWILSASGDHLVKIFNAETGNELMSLKGHTNWVNCAQFSMDDKWIVSASADHTLCVWEAATGTLIHTMVGHTAALTCAAFSPDSQWIISASKDTTIRIWDRVAGTELRQLNGHTSTVKWVQFSPDGKWVVSASSDGTIKIWNVDNGKQHLTLHGHAASVNSAMYSWDGSWIVSASSDGTIKIWSAETGLVHKTIAGGSDWISRASFSPDGNRIVSGGNDERVRVWDASTGELVGRFTGHTWYISDARFSPSGDQIISASSDGTIRIWTSDLTVDSVAPAYRQIGHTDWVNSADYSPSGRWLVTGGADNTVRVWNPVTGDIVQTLTGHTNWVRFATFSPDEQYIVSASNDKTLRVWDLAHESASHELRGHQEIVRSGEFSPDGLQIVSASDDGTIKLWNALNRSEMHTLRGHDGKVTSATFSPTEDLIASSSSDCTIKLWKSSTGEELKTLYGHSRWVNSVMFSPNGQHIVSASGDGTVKIWDINQDREIRTLTGHTDNVRQASYSRDGLWIASVGWDKNLKVWNVQTGECTATFIGDARLYCCTWSPDNQHIVFGGSGGYLYWLNWVE
jgi:WD40 repeat protein